MSQYPPLPASSKILVTFPEILKLTSDSLNNCKDLADTALTCSYITVGNAHQLTVTLGANPVSQNVQFGFKIGGIRNLPSFAKFSQPFSFITKSNSL